MGAAPEDVGSRVQVAVLKGMVSTRSGTPVTTDMSVAVLACIAPGRYEDIMNFQDLS